MNTNNIKSFAKKARLLLLDGVVERLKYWGFAADGSNAQTLETTQGGYIFRGNIFTETGVPAKWNKLKQRLDSKQAVLDVVEEAAYTWFNRLMAIKILEANGHIPSQIAFAERLRTPMIVQNAKRGLYTPNQKTDRELLSEYLQDDKEEQALGLLITDFCNRNRLLHDIFGHIDDYTEILLPPNLLQTDGLLDLINSDAIPADDFKEVELIGWLYQFYIADKKDEVFAGFKQNKKARAEDIPAATQIFTPKWIVKYMVENTVGKIYLDYDAHSQLKTKMKYLVAEDLGVRNEEVISRKPLISNLNQLSLIDPACGSGHILVTGFELLFEMYREEGYTARQAVEQILQHNIYGLDIDDRAMQLARFAVLLKAAQYDAEVLNKGTMPHIYSFPENTIDDFFIPEFVSTSKLGSQYEGFTVAENVLQTWQETFVDEDTGEDVSIDRSKVLISKGSIINAKTIEILEKNDISSLKIDTYSSLRTFLGSSDIDLHATATALALLQQGKNIGSALKISLDDATIAQLHQRYANWQEQEKRATLNIEQQSIWNKLKPYLDVLFVLTKKYTAVVANPPYMGQKSMNDDLKNYVNSRYPNSKADLFAVFMEVCLELTTSKGLMGMINQHSWMFLSSFEALRMHIIGNFGIKNMLHLGPRTFEELSGEVVQSAAFVLENAKKTTNNGTYYRLVEYRNNADKEANFLKNNNRYPNISQTNFEKIPGSPIAYWVSEKVINLFDNTTLSEFCNPRTGMSTSDNNRFLRSWNEVNIKNISFNTQLHEETKTNLKKWYPIQRGGGFRKWYGLSYDIVNWKNDGEDVKKYASDLYKSYSRTIKNIPYYFKEGISWSYITAGQPSFRIFPKGNIILNAGPACFFEVDTNKKYIHGFLNSSLVSKLLAILTPTINFDSGPIAKLPFIKSDNYNQIVGEYVDSNISISKKDWDSRETSWDFEQSPLLNGEGSLRSAYQNWQTAANQDFCQLHANEEALNRIFIDIYGLQDELTPEVPLRDITILQDELERKQLEVIEPNLRANCSAGIELPIKKDEVMGQFLSYLVGIMMGRYRFDKKGLNIAHPNPSDAELEAYNFNGMSINIDEDGIVPLMGDNCAFPDDALLQIKAFILGIWGENTLTDNLNFVQEALGMDLNRWLNDKFWGFHTSMYKKKPIYWLFCSNPKKPEKSAFKVLVYMHRMDKYSVQKIQRNYLHPHQENLNHEIGKLRENFTNLDKTEQRQLEILENQATECRAYNETLKQLATSQITFDLDDGVDINYEKFEGAVGKI